MRSGPCTLTGREFAAKWEELNEEETVTKLSLSFAAAAAAVSYLIRSLHLGACGGSEALNSSSSSSSSNSSSSSSHELLLAGVFVDGQQILARAFCLFPGDSCLLRLTVRSSSSALREAVCAILE